MKQLTVKDLLEILEGVDKNLPVFISVALNKDFERQVQIKIKTYQEIFDHL